MRILQITPTYYPASYWGGPIFSAYGLDKALANMPDVELRVLTTDAAGPRIKDSLETHALDYDALYPNYEVCFCRRIVGHSASLGLLLKLSSLIRWSDVVHLHAIYSFPTIPTLLFCRIWRKPLVWTPHGALLDDQKLAKSRRKNLKRVWISICNALSRRDCVTLHLTSDEEKDVTIRKIPNANVAVIPNGVETLKTLPKKEFLCGGMFQLLFIGRLDPKKGVEILLDAMKQLSDPSITLSICGDGEVQYVVHLKQYAEQLGLLDTGVHFVGRVDGKGKTNAFLESDVCVFPSLSESFAIVVAESLTHGVPVIVSREMPWKSVEDKQCGLWVENTPESLARAIKSIRQMNLAEMGRRGWEWMKEEFGWETIACEMFRIYKSSSKLVDKQGMP
jgi:glycosyltransferase involved in cell wall biosynthesis